MTTTIIFTHFHFIYNSTNCRIILVTAHRNIKKLKYLYDVIYKWDFLKFLLEYLRNDIVKEVD